MKTSGCFLRLCEMFSGTSRRVGHFGGEFLQSLQGCKEEQTRLKRPNKVHSDTMR